MMFKKMTDAMNVIKTLETMYTKVRLLNVSDNTVVYVSSEPKQSLLNSDGQTIHLKPTNFKMMVNENTIEIQITASVQIGGENFLLELNQISQSSFNQIMEAAVTDSLTNLYNRRYIDERLPIDMQTCFSMDEPLSILFIDIDFFKHVNDVNGHITGDQILKHMAQLLRRHIRKGSGWIARYGGDEILICLPGISNKIAKTIANKIRKSIMNYPFSVRNKKINITCSVGVQTVCKDTGIRNVSELLAMVDKKLYCAKQSGRNRVV